MTCPVCGKASPCVHTRRNTSALPDQEVFAGDGRELAPSTPARVAGAQHSATELAWRQEVVSRVQQHRARRRRPADPNALELDFSTDTPHSFGATAHDRALPPPPERFSEILVEWNHVHQEVARPEPKIIRFPRTQPVYVPTVEEVRLDELELAEPVPESPRILEASPEIFETEHQIFESGLLEATPLEALPFEAEPVESYPLPAAIQGQQMDLLPSFADIQLEADPRFDPRSDNDLEVIPRPAPLNQRFVSGLVDAGIVFIATGVFVLTFMEAAEEMPQSRMTLVCMLAAAGIFWLLFQYIFLIFRKATPGMSMFQLELCTFAGTGTSMFDRQRRALASALSGFSMGLGYAWALVDEDRIGWHDRISRTHLRSTASYRFDWQHLLKSRNVARDPYEFDDLKG